MKRAPIIVVVLAAVLGGAYFLTRRGGIGDGLSASGTVEATEASLGFQAAGRIETIRVREGDRVKPGDTLATLDRTEIAARHAQAEAQLAAAQATLTELERGARAEELKQALEADAAAAAKLADAQRDLSRAQLLQREGGISREALDKATLAAEMAARAREQASQQLKLVQSGPRAERIAAQRAMVLSAQALVRQATAQLANAIVTSPFDGVVSVRQREPGETVSPGAPVVTVTNLGDRWVRIYIAENRLSAVKLGATATITTDTYADRSYGGAVSFIASEAEFTPRNVQTTEERVKLVYAVKVRVQGDNTVALKPGMPADVTIKAAP